MSIIKINKQRAINPFDAMLNDFFEGEFLPAFQNRSRVVGAVPAANIIETENNFHVELAAPGMSKEDFKIEIDDDLLSIRSEKKEENEENTQKYTKKEFSFSSFVRSFRLPEHVDSEAVSASYENGILNLEIPKKEVKETSKVRQVEIK